MSNFISIVVILGMVATAACKKEEKKESDTATVVAEPAEPKAEAVKVEAPTPSEVEDSTMINRMGHCPSSVPGTTTEVTMGEGVVLVTIVAKEEASAIEVQKRAGHLAGLNDADMSTIKHSGNGTGGGELGKCPVVLGISAIKVEDTKEGSKITMTPKKAGELAKLGQMAMSRAEGLKTAGLGKGDGHGKGDGKGGGDGHGGGHGE